MSFFSYGSIAFEITKTHEFSQEAVKTEDGVDYLYTKFRITIEGILNPSAMSYAPTPIGPVRTVGVLPPLTNVAIRHYLMTPRRQLVYAEGGIVVLESPLPGQEMDFKNGPHPISCTVTKLLGARTWHIVYTVETYVSECPNGFGGPIASSRFSQRMELDQNFYSSIVTSGTTYFDTNILQSLALTCDAYRAYIFQAVPAKYGYQRVNVNVAIDSDNSALHWQIRDQEVAYHMGDTSAAGSGSWAGTYATKVDGEFILETMQSESGIPNGMTIGRFNCTIEGSKKASNSILCQMAFSLAANKIVLVPGYNGADLPFMRIRHICITQSIAATAVSLSVHFQMVPMPQSRFNGIDTPALDVDDVFQSGEFINPVPISGGGTRGSDPDVIVCSAITNACINQEFFRYAPDQNGTAYPIAGTLPDVRVVPISRIPYSPNRYKANQTSVNAGYTDYRVRTTRRTQTGKTSSPVSAPVGNQGSQNEAPVTMSILTLASPSTVKVCEWTAERIGAPPSPPDPTSYDPNAVLISSDFTSDSWDLLYDGSTRSYRCSGVYTYALKKVEGISGTVLIDASDPVDYDYGAQDGLSSYVVGTGAVTGNAGPGQTVHGIIDPPQPQSSQA